MADLNEFKKMNLGLQIGCVTTLERVPLINHLVEMSLLSNKNIYMSVNNLIKARQKLATSRTLVHYVPSCPLYTPICQGPKFTCSHLSCEFQIPHYVDSVECCTNITTYRPMRSFSTHDEFILSSQTRLDRYKDRRSQILTFLVTGLMCGM